MFNPKGLLPVLLIAATILTAPAAQALDGESQGVYQGIYDGRTVKASLDYLETSVTGMLDIGDQHYLLQADKRDSTGYTGKLFNIAGGQELDVRLQLNNGLLQIQVTGQETAMSFELEKSTR